MWYSTIQGIKGSEQLGAVKYKNVRDQNSVVQGIVFTSQNSAVHPSVPENASHLQNLVFSLHRIIPAFSMKLKNFCYHLPHTSNFRSLSLIASHNYESKSQHRKNYKISVFPWFSIRW